jgi:pyruvyltransferase
VENALGDVVWGSGLHPYEYEDFWKNNSKKELELTVLAVRGPFTADALRAREQTVPEIYGDPGILTPLVYPKAREPKRKVIIIPHLSEYAKIKEEAEKFGVRVVHPGVDWKQVADEITEAERVISGSLHGLILSDAYGVPSTWFRPTYFEGLLKYHDYFLGTGRVVNPYYSLESAITAPGIAAISMCAQQQALQAAFDKDLVKAHCFENFSPEAKFLGGMDKFYKVQVRNGLAQSAIALNEAAPAIATSIVAPPTIVEVSSRQPGSYKDHYPFEKGSYSAPSILVSTLKGGYHLNLEGCRHNVAAEDGRLFFDTFSHMQQEDPKLLAIAAESFAKHREKSGYIDDKGISIVNQSTENYFYWLMQSLPSVLAYQATSASDGGKNILSQSKLSWQEDSLEILVPV